MYQYMHLDHPIPSCEIAGLKWDDHECKWLFEYAIKTPIEITNENEQPLMVYEYISDLHVKVADRQYKDAVNVQFTKLDEYMELLDRQYAADMMFRKMWRDKHPDAVVPSHSLRTVDHGEYHAQELADLNIHYVVGIMENHEGSSVFVVG